MTTTGKALTRKPEGSTPSTKEWEGNALRNVHQRANDYAQEHGAGSAALLCVCALQERVGRRVTGLDGAAAGAPSLLVPHPILCWAAPSCGGTADQV